MCVRLGNEAAVARAGVFVVAGEDAFFAFALVSGVCFLICCACFALIKSINGEVEFVCPC